MYYVYVLQSQKSKDRLYIGFTADLKKRLEAHSAPAKDQYTYRYYPWELKTYIVFNNEFSARRFERYLKTSSGRTFVKKHLL